MKLNEIQYQILNALYFVEPFDTLVNEVADAEPVIADELKTLIAKRLVQAMQFDPVSKDYISTYLADADDMRAFHYLATKEGLLTHQGYR
jgi:hypothetical protein